MIIVHVNSWIFIFYLLYRKKALVCVGIFMMTNKMINTKERKGEGGLNRS